MGRSFGYIAANYLQTPGRAIIICKQSFLKTKKSTFNNYLIAALTKPSTS